MRKIETELLAAIRAGRAFNKDNTRFDPGHGAFTRKGQAFCLVLGQSAPVTDSQWF
jgi:hypothetical protein